MKGSGKAKKNDEKNDQRYIIKDELPHLNGLGLVESVDGFFISYNLHWILLSFSLPPLFNLLFIPGLVQLFH